MTEVVIHAPSVDALFDEWSPEPIERRPLRDEVRDRIVEQWVEAKRTEGADALVLLLPATERRENLDEAVRNAVHADMETMEEECRRHWLRRSLRARKTRIGIALFVVCLLISAGINYGQSDAWSDTLAQTFVGHRVGGAVGPGPARRQCRVEPPGAQALCRAGGGGDPSPLGRTSRKVPRVIIVSGRIRVAEDQVPAFLEASRDAVAQARRTEGCVDFVVAGDPLEPDRVNVYEEWESEEALLRFRGDGPSQEMGARIVDAQVRRHHVSRSGPA